MSQQLIDRKALSSSNWFFGIYASLQKWISKEIIDFDPFDDEVIVAQELVDQLRRAQSTKPELSA
jgi:hypothetical protein